MRSRVVTLVLLALVAVIGTGLRWIDPWDSRATFDSLQYAHSAYRFEGQTEQQAWQSAAALRCREWTRVRPAPGWVRVSLPRPGALFRNECRGQTYHALSNPRYESIFEARPGYPRTVAALSPVFGDTAFAVAALVPAAATAFLGGVAALLLGVGRWGAAAAVAVVLLLPSGLYLTRLGPDGLVGLGIMLALVGALLVLRTGRVALGATLLGAALLVLIPVKAPNAIALGATLAGAAALVTWRAARDVRRRAVVVAGVSAAGALAGLAISSALGWAGLSTTLQDLATNHFFRRPVPHPYRYLLRADGHLIASAGPHALALIAIAALCVVGAWMAVRRGRAGWLVVAVGASGLLQVLVHPVPSEAGRLAGPLWLALAVGLATTSAAARRPAGLPSEGATRPR